MIGNDEQEPGAQLASRLAAARAQIAGLMDDSPDLICSFTADGRYQYANHAFAERTGRPLADIIGKCVWDLLPNDDADQCFGLLSEVFRTGEKKLVEQCVSRSEGAEYFLVTITPIKDAAGLVVAVVSASRDITARKQLELELKQTTTLLEQAFEQSPVPMVLVSAPDMTFRIVNPACREFLGIDDEPTLLGTSLLEFKPSFQDFDKDGNLGSIVDLPLARALGGEKVLGVERRIVRKDGTTRWELVSGVPIRDTDGKLMAGYLVMMDITEGKRAEQALVESREHLQSILDSSPSLVYVKDLDGRFTLVNREFESLFQMSRAQLLGKTSHELLPKRDADAHRSNDLEVMASGLSMSVEESNEEADGTHTYLSTKFPLFGLDGKMTGVCGISTDVTEHKRADAERSRLEVQLAQSQKMESVGRLAGGVAHDFNNMLGVILGHVELALEQVTPTQLLYSDLNEIQQAGRRSAELTRQLLAFARKQTVAPVVLDLNETITGMLKMLQRIIGEDIELRWQPQVGVWLVKIDPSQVDQVLANLCVNARDAISEIGQVTIQTINSTFDADYCAEHAGHAPGDYVCLAVSDNGAGMDQETLSNLFEPFFTTKSVGKGTGLGLATVYGIGKQNGGFITVHSERGSGSVFKVFLPRHWGEQPQTSAKDVRPTLQGQETILLVEDEPSLLRMTEKLLARLGYTVLAASSPGEAIRLAGACTSRLNLLITDVIMPEMNGRDLACHMLSVYPEMKRLYMSGYTADVIAHHGVLDEGVHFIQKPFSLKDLAAKVRSTLDGDAPRAL